LLCHVWDLTSVFVVSKGMEYSPLTSLFVGSDYDHQDISSLMG